MSRELKIRITGDASGLQAATDDAADIVHKFGGRVNALGVAAGNLLAHGLKTGAGAIGGFLRDSIGAASDIAETQSKVGVLFGDQAGAIEQFASGAATAFGQTKQQAMDAASTFATFGKAAGLGGKDLTGFATGLTGLASDLASFGNTDVDTAIQAISGALRGESESIRQYGVLLDESTLKNEALKLGLISSTKDALTPANKVLAAQAAIMAQTTAAQGDFARTSDGLANKQRIVAAQIGNLKTTIGDAFLPVVLAVTTALSTKLLPILERVGPIIAGEVAGGIRAFVSAFKAFDGDVTSSGFPGFMERVAFVARTVVERFRELWPTIKTVGGVVRDVAVAAFGFFADHLDQIRSVLSLVGPPVAAAVAGFMAFQKVAAAAKAVQAFALGIKAVGIALAANPIGLAVAAIAAVGVALYIAYQRSERFREVVTELGARIAGFVARIREAFAGGGIGAAFGVALDGIKSALGDLGGWLQSTALPFLGEKALALAGLLGGWIAQAAGYLGDHLPGWLATLGGWIVDTALPWLADKAAAFAGLLGGWIADAAGYLRDNLPGWLGTLTEWLVGTALPWLIEQTAKFALKLSDWILDAAAYLVSNLPGWLASLAGWILTDALPAIAGFGIDMAGKLGDAFLGALTFMGEIAGNIVDGLIRGLGEMAGRLTSAVKSWVRDNIAAPIRKVLGIDSPSKVAAGIGRNVAEGLAIGMLDGAGVVADAAGGLAAAAVPGVSTGPGGTFTTSAAFIPAGPGTGAVGGSGGPVTINITTAADPTAVVTAVKTYARQNGGVPW